MQTTIGRTNPPIPIDDEISPYQRFQFLYCHLLRVISTIQKFFFHSCPHSLTACIIGDVSRFTHKGALTAFAGVDPGVNESGTYEQKSVPTSKRGSSDLRKTLFQVMDALIKTKPQDDPVYQFLDKKRAQGKPYYVYMTAGANKFLRIYYGRVKEYLSSLSES